MQRRGLGFLAAALLMILSRVYGGTHYASHVVGGAMTGIVAAAGSLGLSGRQAR